MYQDVVGHFLLLLLTIQQLLQDKQVYLVLLMFDKHIFKVLVLTALQTLLLQQVLKLVWGSVLYQLVP